MTSAQFIRHTSCLISSSAITTRTVIEWIGYDLCDKLDIHHRRNSMAVNHLSIVVQHDDIEFHSKKPFFSGLWGSRCEWKSRNSAVLGAYWFTAWQTSPNIMTMQSHPNVLFRWWNIVMAPDAERRATLANVLSMFGLHLRAAIRTT